MGIKCHTRVSILHLTALGIEIYVCLIVLIITERYFGVISDSVLGLLLGFLLCINE